MTSSFRVFTDETQEENIETKHDGLLINHSKTVYELSSFQYMPVHFRGLVTRELGMVAAGTKAEDTPFHKLKKIAINPNESAEDRMQAVRYMCSIPYKDQLIHLIEATTCIVKDTTISIYKRFHFFSNNKAYFKLNDHLVHEMFYTFWEYCNEVKGPLELSNLCARYIIAQYPRDAEKRQNVLDWIVDWLESTLDDQSKADLADILTSCGDWDEASYGTSILKTLGGSESFVENKQNVHTDSLTESSKRIIRALQGLQAVDLEDIRTDLLKIAKDATEQEAIHHFVFRATTDPTLYQGITLEKIAGLVYAKCKTLASFETCKQRFVEEIVDAHQTCSTGYLLRCCNVLQGLVDDAEFELRLSPKDELRTILFGKINESIMNMGAETIDALLTSISTDKAEAKQIMTLVDQRDEIWPDYEAIICRETFDGIVDDIYNEYIGVTSLT